MRAIDGDRLKRKAQKVATEAWKMKIKASVEMILNEFIDWINEAPTIEPEHKKGKWISIGMADAVGCESAMWGDEIAYHICEKCLKQALERDGDEVLSDFCPHCGARMESE